MAPCLTVHETVDRSHNHVQVLGGGHVLHEAVNQRFPTTCRADAPGTALQAQVLEAEWLDHLLGDVDGVVHDVECVYGRRGCG